MATIFRVPATQNFPENFARRTFWFSKIIADSHFLAGVVVVRPCWWVAVTMAWRVFRLRIEERPPIRRVLRIN